MIIKINNKIKKLKNTVIKCFVRIYFTPSNIQFYIKRSNRWLLSTTRKRFSEEKPKFILVPRPDTDLYLDRSDPYLKTEYFDNYRYYFEYIKNFDMINKLCLNFKIKKLLHPPLKDKDFLTFENVYSSFESQSKELCDYQIRIFNNQSENQKLILMFNTNIIMVQIKNPINLKEYNFDNLLSDYHVVECMNSSESESEEEREFKEYNYASEYFPITINNLETSCYMIGIKQDKYLKSFFKKTKVSLNDQQVYFIINVPTGSSDLNYISQYFNIFLSIIDLKKKYIPSFD